MNELLEELRRALPLDDLLVDLPGATVAENLPDADGEIVQRLRHLLAGHVSSS